jgi:integrase
MKGLYKMAGSRYWWYRWTGPDGKRHSMSTKTEDESEAIVKARQVHVDFTVAVPRNPLIPLVDRYLGEAQTRNKKPMRSETAKNNRTVLVKFVKDTGADYVSNVTTKTLQRWVDQLRKTHKPETICSYTNVVLAFGRWLHKSGRVTYFPFDGFERPERPVKGRLHFLTKEAATKLIETAPDDHLRFILYCGFHAGLRKGEVGWAKVDWFDLENGLIHVVNDPEAGVFLKDENRTVPMTKPFREFLTGYLKGRRGDQYVLEPAKLQKGKWRYRVDFKKSFNSYVKGACTPHDMRRSFASNLVSKGESVYIVAKWLGDRVEVVERSYGHLSPGAGDINRLL